MTLFLSNKKRSGATFAGIFGVAFGSMLLLCGAGLTPAGDVQKSDLNANGFSITNAATIQAASFVGNGAGLTNLPSGSPSFVRKTANFTASAGMTYGMDTTGGTITATPPSTPNDGDWFVVFDVAKQWTLHPAAVGSSGVTFIDTAHVAATPGPYNLNAVPYAGQGLIRFVWLASTSSWSVN